MNATEKNKAIVIRFNREVIEAGNPESFKELVADNCVNHSAPAGSSSGPDGMIYFLFNVLKKGFPDIKVIIHDQVAEGDKVTTRKSLHGTHTGEFMGIPATGKKATIEVIDIIRLHEGKYADHWGISTIPIVIAELSKK